MVKWNPELLRRSIAPGIDEFVSADIPDLRPNHPECDFWITNHFLNSTLRTPYKGWVRQYAINLIFRAEALFRYYHEARDLTLRYLHENDPHNPKIGQYYRAIAGWENVLLHWAGSFSTIWKASKAPLFQPDDQSVEERLYKLWTISKHFSSRIADKTLNEDETIPIWLTNDGLQSSESTVGFGEISESVTNIANLAEEIIDPITFAREVKK